MKNRMNIIKRFLTLLVTASITLSYATPVSVYAENIGACENDSVCCVSNLSESPISSGGKSVEVGSRIFELIFGKNKKKQTDEDIYLCPGGDAFGVKIYGSGVTVSKVVAELSSGELSADDTIVSIDGKGVSSIADVKEALSASGGERMRFEILRGGKKIFTDITPKSAGGEYHLGVILSDGASGIGTITYYDPNTRAFGGLGHGICGKSQEVLKMTRGEVTGVILAGATRGEPTKPGELRGVLTDKIIGEVNANTECGVFGSLSAEAVPSVSEAISIAHRKDVREGDACIISTIKSGKKAEYKITIHDIDISSEGTKSFKITVTDETLLALTGGIVRGMSGSPIIQDGKLVGAVTHVMVADPTEGYGIFIENMLNAANQQVQPKAA